MRKLDNADSEINANTRMENKYILDTWQLLSRRELSKSEIVTRLRKERYIIEWPLEY